MKSIENGNAARCFENKGLKLNFFVGIVFLEVELPRNALKSKKFDTWFSVHADLLILVAH